jgi:hypothetical protein
MKPEYDFSKMKPQKNPYSKEIEYTDEPIGEVTIIPDFLLLPEKLKAKPKRDIFAELIEGFNALEKQREGQRPSRPAHPHGRAVSRHGAAVGVGLSYYIFNSKSGNKYAG